MTQAPLTLFGDGEGRLIPLEEGGASEDQTKVPPECPLPDDNEVLQVYEEERLRSSNSASVVALWQPRTGSAQGRLGHPISELLKVRLPKLLTRQPTTSQLGRSSLTYPPA